METVVLQPLGNVLLHDAGLLPDVGEIHNELVRTSVVFVGGRDVEVRLQPGLHVVRVQDGVTATVQDALLAEHGAVHPRNAGDAGLAPRRRRDGTGRVGAGGGRVDDAVTGEVRCQVRFCADRSQTGAAAAVGDAEGLVQVQVAHVRTDHAGGGQAQLGIHVSTIHVHLAAMFVDGGANLLNVVFEECPRGRVGDHQAGQAVLVLGAEVLELLEVHAPRVLDPLDLHAAHCRGGRVRAVSRPRDDAHVAVAFALRLQVLAND
mmetsp:Transcript_12259/g.23176  ORF Transcript_12259/g.23176 Transcript_12259/m.23176 type:complete len:262 (-) Transcript_12259:1870-2655(-)